MSLSLGTGAAIILILALWMPVTALSTSLAAIFWIKEYPFYVDWLKAPISGFDAVGVQAG